MRHIKLAFWSLVLLLTVLWLVAEPSVFQPVSFMALRSAMVQYSGIIAMGAMAVAMMLALRPRWPERWFGGLGPHGTSGAWCATAHRKYG